MATSQKKSGGSKKYGRNRGRYSGPNKLHKTAGTNSQVRDFGAGDFFPVGHTVVTADGTVSAKTTSIGRALKLAWENGQTAVIR